jgi:2'-5' RNA ligase
VTAALFVAIVPPPDAIASLQTALDRLREATPELAWVAPRRWHVTLCFLGSYEPNEALRSELARVATSQEEIAIEVAGAGRFGDRVLFANLAGDLKPLAAGVTRAAERCGYEVEDRPFRGHLTLARSRRTRIDLRPLVAALAEVHGPVWRVNELRLMRSAQSDYETVDSWPLKSSASTYR